MNTLSLWHLLHAVVIAVFIAIVAGRAVGAQTADPAALAQSAFAAICTTPGQTAVMVDARMRAFVAENGGQGLPFAVDFYDTTLGDEAEDVTPGTNRRCEVAFAGDHTDAATRTLLTAMEGPPVFGTEIDLPEGFAANDGTAFIQARLLNNRGTRAVVHVGTRPGPDGIETFINVERLRTTAQEN